MFIKSQGRSVLVNTEFVYVPTTEESNKRVMCEKEGVKVILGNYCCNDRAKEVLDTICDAIEDGMDLIECDSKVGQAVSRNCVFEMPIN